MVKSMYKYSLPPSFNFLTTWWKEPFAMVFFEFEHHFTQDDLVKLWQGILPSEARKDASSGIQHSFTEIDFGMNLLSGREKLLPSEKLTATSYKGWDLLNHKPSDLDAGFPTNIQWMVFKVKQKAMSEYYSLTADKMDGYGMPTKNYAPSSKVWSWIPFFQQWQSDITTEKINNSYRYNWPYDFFSLIELAKVEETVKLAPHIGPDLPIPPTPALPDILEQLPQQSPVDVDINPPPADYEEDIEFIGDATFEIKDL